MRYLFLLTRPLRDVTNMKRLHTQTIKISTHTPLAGRDTISVYDRGESIISTHTPLAGRDKMSGDELDDWDNFYSHAPCGT